MTVSICERPRIVAAGAILQKTAGAWVFSHLEKESMNDVSLIVFSVLGGAITGIYMLGFFTRRVDGFAVNVALGFAIALNIQLGLGVMRVLPETWRIGVHSYWVGAVVNVAHPHRLRNRPRAEVAVAGPHRSNRLDAGGEEAAIGGYACLR